MADQKKKVINNVDGDFFVDTTCINCDTCRQLAKSSFKDNGQFSYVFEQPSNEDDIKNAIKALLCCPTGSIGTNYKYNYRIKDEIEHFPTLIEDEVYYCGFNSKKSYGANSYFIKSTKGNWLIESPRFQNNLVNKFRQMGGIKYIFLSHKDDIADAHKYSKEFNATKIIHTYETKNKSDYEILLEESSKKSNKLNLLDFEYHTNYTYSTNDFIIISTPGHTRGHLVLLYKNKFLFTGDHLGFDPAQNRLDSNAEHCWYNYNIQLASVKKLLEYKFLWILPGHGHSIKYKSYEEASHSIIKFLKEQ